MGGRLSLATDIINEPGESLTPSAGEKKVPLARIRISDTGVGMSHETILKAFDPFFSTKEKEKGTGLGLTMAYSIVQEHGGFIEVSSTEGEGSTFTVLLPVTEEFEADCTVKEIPELYHGSGNILVVDDEEVMRNVVVNILNECGYTPLIAENGHEAVETLRCRGNDIRLVILDMAMPGMSGKEAFIEIKSISPDIKVIMSSGFSRDQRVVESMEKGVNRFIQKPYTLYSLSRAIYEVLRESPSLK